MKWIILSNKHEQNFDLDGALHDCGVDWYKNNNKIETGDIVYIYESRPEQYIKYKCIVTADRKTVSTFNDEKYGGPGPRASLGDISFETKLVYEFKNPVTLEELSKHGVSKKRIPVMKETGKPEVFEFLEEYEAEERKSEDDYNPNQDTDMDFQVPPGDEREVTVSERVHQRVFREGLLRKYPHCCLCSVTNPELLFASHIKPWDKSTSMEKTNLNNGLLLCPNHDKLFDKGFISFDSNGSILISEQLSDMDRTFMNVNPNSTLEMNDEMKEFMEFHRNNVFKK